MPASEFENGDNFNNDEILSFVQNSKGILTPPNIYFIKKTYTDKQIINFNELQQKKKRFRQCYNKLCLTDLNNSTLWSKQKLNKSMICKTCETAYKNKQYCHFCIQIYLNAEVSSIIDDKDWIECEDCKSWVFTCLLFILVNFDNRLTLNVNKSMVLRL